VTQADGPTRVDDDWLRKIAAEYEAHVAADHSTRVTPIADSHNVSIHTATNWVEAARVRGFLARMRRDQILPPGIS
jgi:transposase